MVLHEAVEVHDNLNPAIWNKDGTLRPEVEEKLFEIVSEFSDSCTIPLDIADVHLVGSNASFNYNDSSDLDVHIVVNFELIDADSDILQAAYNREKAAFNENYPITIHGVSIEMYIEDIKAGTMSNGIYSLLKKKWIKFPKPIVVDAHYDFNDSVSKWSDRINASIEINDEDELKRLLNTAYMMRKNSLAIDGEYGKGNLLFKELRGKGLIQDIKDAITDIKVSKLSLESFNRNEVVLDEEVLDEDEIVENKRTKIINDTKMSGKSGKKRYDKRTKSHLSNQVKQFNDLDMNKLFKEDILVINLSVHGETNDYIVKISFGGLLETLQKRLKNMDGVELNASIVISGLMSCFNTSDVYVHCSCPDFKYRYDYVTREKQKINSQGTPDDPQNRPANKTNPNDDLGSGCKHILLVLSNKSWIIKVASVITNYVKYMKKHYEQQYADLIYPALYGKKYEGDVQTNMDDSDELATGKDDIDASNEEARTRGQFKKGNTSGVRFASNKESDVPEDQMSLNF